MMWSHVYPPSSASLPRTPWLPEAKKSDCESQRTHSPPPSSHSWACVRGKGKVIIFFNGCMFCTRVTCGQVLWMIWLFVYVFLLLCRHASYPLSCSLWMICGVQPDVCDSLWPSTNEYDRLIYHGLAQASGQTALPPLNAMQHPHCITQHNTHRLTNTWTRVRVGTRFNLMRMKRRQ